jgi:hypothetical protein
LQKTYETIAAGLHAGRVLVLRSLCRAQTPGRPWGEFGACPKLRKPKRRAFWFPLRGRKPSAFALGVCAAHKLLDASQPASPPAAFVSAYLRPGVHRGRLNAGLLNSELPDC